ncbi:MAG: DUF3347 domain-containing protein [Chitinophagaceae bacterium]|nr:DUF3347 domain-containing protein [Chitinophagaceae bacterium]
MKYLLMLLFVSASLFACKNKEDKTSEAPEVKKDSNALMYSEPFLLSFNSALNAYYALKDAFVAGDTAKINAAAVQLKKLVDSLKLDELQKRDTVAFQGINGRTGDVASEIDGMLGEKDIEKKRESFEMISNAFYDIVRAVRPNGATVYYQYCPMAFNDKGAYWLSNADSIRNPYFGKKMLTCGEVKETMKY